MTFPFSAICGQPELKLALMLASVDWRLSVLLKGDKGSGKSTAARALADILPGDALFVNLPIGATEDRLLGGLDLTEALAGQARLKRGLVHEAHGGILYIDEINLLADSLTDALLDVASSGRHRVERDGFSTSDDAQFVLLGSMNLEEGALRPQLLDRFALSVDVQAPRSAEDRSRIVQARLQFDADPAAFRSRFENEQQRLKNSIAAARVRLGEIQFTDELLLAIANAVCEAGVVSLRADLAVLRAAIAHAALDNRREVATNDVDVVLPLVLHHRALHHRAKLPPRPPAPEAPHRNPGEARESSSESGERVFPSDPQPAPEIRVQSSGAMRGITAATSRAGSSSASSDPSGDRLHVVASFTQAFRNTGVARLQGDQLVFHGSQPNSATRFIFVIDSSGSHSAQQRMRAVKGAVVGLLESSIAHRDEVAVIAFRGTKAEVVLEPCRDAAAAQRALEFLPTGGRTPLAHALELAASMANDSSVVVLITDGRANVARASGDPWADALDAARTLQCPSLVVDSSIGAASHHAIAELAAAMAAKHLRLDELNETALLSFLHS
jgi:magnesium chelatase subunit D